jgi:hypothetical protein
LIIEMGVLGLVWGVDGDGLIDMLPRRPGRVQNAKS